MNTDKNLELLDEILKNIRPELLLEISKKLNEWIPYTAALSDKNTILYSMAPDLYSLLLESNTDKKESMAARIRTYLVQQLAYGFLALDRIDELYPTDKNARIHPSEELPDA